MKDRMRERAVLVALCLTCLAAPAQAQYTGIYTFNLPYDGCCPNLANLLAQGRDGNLYSTMPTGVASAYYGTWFEYPLGGLPAIHPLAAGPYVPASGLTLGIDGNLYGATQHGGLGNGAYGVLFKISGGGLIPVYYFTGGANGTYPYAPPIQGPDGNLYGVTYDGSTAGVVYKVLTASGTLAWVRALPSGTKAPLIIASDGNFYGTYPHGGMTLNGVAPSNNNGGGIFQVTPTGVVTGVYNINPLDTSITINGGQGDGQQPWGPVMQGKDGNLYGAASGGGSANGGVVYKVGLNGSGFKVLHNFQAADGTAPEGGLLQGSDGFLYGMCSDTGTAQGQQVAKGTLFKVDPGGGNFVRLFQFYRASGVSGVGPGSAPLATPTLHTNGLIYGMTSTGGTGNGSSKYGAYDDGGELFRYNAGLSPFISIVGRRSGNVNDRVGIIGQGFLSATGVTFGGISALWAPGTVSIASDTYMTVTIPTGARTGPVTVLMGAGSLSTLYNFTISCSGMCAHPLD